VMARMLGLTLTYEATADFELVTRLEKLILANKANMTTTLPVDNAFSDLASSFRSRPSHHRQIDDDDDDVDVPDSSRSNGGHTARSRSRSLSPMRTRDPNIY